MRLLLDVDGVIADFDTPARRVHGITVSMMKGCRGDWMWPLKVGMTMDYFWKPIDRYSFWRYQVRPYRGARAFVKALRQRGEVMFCTTPSRSAICASAKIDWLRKYIGPVDTVDYIICGSHKHWLANSQTLLIDDRDKNCEDFRANGGKAVLVPQPWNNAHDLPGVGYGRVDLNFVIKAVDTVLKP